MFETQDNVQIALKEEVYFFNGTIHAATGKHLVITCHAMDIAHCPQGTPIQVSQAANEVCYKFETEVVRALGNSLITPLWTPEAVQRRRSPRLACDLPATYLLQRSRNVGSKAIEPKEMPAQVRDLGVGGVKAWVGEVLITGTPIRLEMDLGEDGRITAEATVLRCWARPASSLLEQPHLPYQATFKFTLLDRLQQMLLLRLVQHHPTL